MSLVVGAIGDFTTLVQGFKDAWAARFGDVPKDIFALEDVAAVLADVGVPDAKLAELLLDVLGHVVQIRQTLPYDVNGGNWVFSAHPEPSWR